VRISIRFALVVVFVRFALVSIRERNPNEALNEFPEDWCRNGGDIGRHDCFCGASCRSGTNAGASCAQYSTLQNAVPSTQAYESIVVSWSDQLTSDLQSEATAVSNNNQSAVSTYANAILNDSNNVSNYLTADLGWMNSVTYEYRLLQSEEPTSNYAKAEFPESTTLDNEALLAYGTAEAYSAAASQLPGSGTSLLWGLTCLGAAIIGVAGGPVTEALDLSVAEAIAAAAGYVGVGCGLEAL
jgi:hypothetical protein